LRSNPAEKARPSALSTIALMPSSCSNEPRACSISAIMALFSALSCLGRFMTMWPIPASTRVMIAE
jgi:hypothetical protein